MDSWTLTNVQFSCPEKKWAKGGRPLAPYPMPNFVPHNSTVPDIHPGERCLGAAKPVGLSNAQRAGRLEP